MAWTIDDENAFFRDRGVATSMDMDLTGARDHFARYPALAARQASLVRATAQIMGATSWVQVFDVMEDNPYAKAWFDISTGVIAVEERVVSWLEEALQAAGTTGPWMRRDVEDIKQSLGALFHEMTHGGGPQDRETYVKERIATNEDERAQLLLEGGTELFVQTSINEFLTRTGMTEVIPGILDAEYHNHYPSEVAFVHELLRGMALTGETTEAALLTVWAHRGFSAAGLTDLVAATAADPQRVTSQTRDAAVAEILNAVDTMRWTKTLPRTLPLWDEYCTQLGATAGATALGAMRNALASRPERALG